MEASASDPGADEGVASGSKALLGKRSNAAVYADAEQASSVHSLMQACATAFAGMRSPIKQMVRMCVFNVPSHQYCLEITSVYEYTCRIRTQTYTHTHTHTRTHTYRSR